MSSDYKELKKEALAWAESKQQAGAGIGQILAALCEAMIEIVPKNDIPLRLANLEAPIVHLNKVIAQERTEFEASPRSRLHVVPPQN